MKKNYFVPATDVVALAGGNIMQMPAVSPATSNPDPNNNNPGGGGGPIGD